jgi:hypothetical protein
MAKKKSNKKEKAPETQRRFPTTEGRKITKRKESMKEKVEVKTPGGADKASRIVGTIFIGLGILLVAFGIYSFLNFRAEPTYNEELAIPTMEYITDLTNGEEIVVRGNAPGLDSVAVFINDERVAETRVRDDSYEFTYEVEAEGEYAVSVAGLQGFPFREISARTTAEVAVVDRTGPDTEEIDLVYTKETDESAFVLSGNVEPNADIEVRRGVSTYQATADEQGDFRIEGIALDEGKNVFYLSLTDQAGNTVSLDEKVRVAYSPGADVNGDGVTDRDVAGADDTLPQASGEFDSLIARNLMLIFAIAAIFVFSGSSIYALKRK